MSQGNTMTIRSLFDSTNDIDRTIEKVISFGADKEQSLKAEISEYVVTDHIEDQFRSLLDRMQYAMDSGEENEIGVWVSGFYGSGKSSLTKYLGLALDDHCTIEGTPFLKYLQNRLHDPTTKTQLATVAQRYPSAIVMLDLASEMLAGATMEDVSTVLYYKVLQWAGYSRNIKIATLERKLEKEDRFQEFLDKVETKMPGVAWNDLQNDALIVDRVVGEIVHDMYPDLFPEKNSFLSDTGNIVQFENERVEEMIDIVREKSGKDNVIFIVDEVGQYVAARDNLILNLDGLAKNLKALGNGKAWIISTAQQTLTEDDRNAALNTDKLYKLKDRFPIQINLESSDIREICYRRLLGKSADGEAKLGQLFDQHGQALRQSTKLEDAKYYDAELNRQDFINLYPFLPAHFDILLRLLGALAKSTGGIGLRSAIKVVQDVLKGDGGPLAMAEQSVGQLVTTVTLYDELEKDIQQAFPSVHKALGDAMIRCHDKPVHQEVAKSVAVLQILGNLPVTVANVASLMHPSVTAVSRRDEVDNAVTDLLNDKYVPFGDNDGNLAFLSEKLRDIEEERGTIALRTTDVRRIFNEALREVFNPLPRTSVQSTLTVSAGLKAQVGSDERSLAGENNPVQIIVEQVPVSDYDAAKNRVLDESRTNTLRNKILLLAREDDELNELAGEIYRCQRIAELHRNEPDPEVKDYCNNQLDRANKLTLDLQSKIKQALQAGSLFFRGEQTAVSALDANLLEATKKQLKDVAAQVFERYAEAPVRVDTGVAEKILKTPNPASIPSKLDELGLVQSNAGQASFNTDHKAITSLRDFIENRGTVEGKRLLDHFKEPPFGWAPDTTRYILAVMLIASEIKLKVSGGKAVTAAGEKAIDALKTNNAFGKISVSLRDDRPSNEALSRAASRLTELLGDTVIPLEQEISQACVRHLPGFQRDYAPLAEKLDRLGLPGSARIRSLNDGLTDILQTDASDAPQRLGAETSDVYNNLSWALEIKRAFDNGLETTLRDVQAHRHGIEALPQAGIPGQLREEVADDLESLSERLAKEDFYKHAADFNTQLTHLQTCVGKAVSEWQEQQKQQLHKNIAELSNIPEWQELTQEEQSNAVQRLEGLAEEVTKDLAGLNKLLSRGHDISLTVTEVKDGIKRRGHERIRQRQEESEPAGAGDGQTCLSKTVSVPAKMTQPEDIDALIQQLNNLRAQLGLYATAEITFDIAQEQE